MVTKEQHRPDDHQAVWQLSRADHAECQPSKGRQVPGCVAKTPDNVAKRLANRAVDALQVGPKVRKPPGEKRRQEVGHGTDDEDDAVTVRDRVDRASKRHTREVGERAARGRDPVRCDQELTADDVGQARGETGEEEPIH